MLLRRLAFLAFRKPSAAPESSPGQALRFASLLALFLSAAASFACQPGDSERQEGEPASPEAEREGYLEELAPLGLEAELTVDEFVAELGPIRWFGVSPDGTMAVSQLNDHLIRLLDSAGGFQGSIGGGGGVAGGGPPGFDLQGGAGWMGDTLWVSDVTLGRIALYSNELELLRLLPPMVGARAREGDEARFPSFLSVSPLAVYPGDSLLVAANQAMGEPSEPFAGGIHLFRVSADGRIQNHVQELPEGEARIDPRFGNRPSAASDSQAAGDPPTPRGPQAATSLLDVAAQGGRVATITMDGDLSDAGSWWLRVVDGFGGLLVSRRFPFKGGSFPMGVIVGSDQRLWVQFEVGVDSSSCLVLSPEGNPLGLLLLPGQARLLEADEAHLWLETTDDLGLTTLVRYRVTETG